MSELAFDSFQKAVATAGTPVQLTATSTLVRYVQIRAKFSNTGFIYVGKAGVSSTTGLQLSKSDTIVYSDPGSNLTATIDLSKIYLDCSVNGEGVSVFYAK